MNANKMVEALEAEIANLTRLYQSEIERGQRMLQEGLDRSNQSRPRFASSWRATTFRRLSGATRFNRNS